MGTILRTTPLQKNGTYLFNCNAGQNISFIAGSSNPFTYKFEQDVVIAKDLLVGTSNSHTITSAGDIIAYNSSDKKLKENIKAIENPLQKIKTIGGYKFRWKEDATKLKAGKEDYGVIAQEIQSIIPEAVRETDGVLQVEYIKIIPLLIESIKELTNKVETLEKRLGE